LGSKRAWVWGKSCKRCPTEVAWRKEESADTVSAHERAR
jgi:hypothetical protein